MEGLGVFALDKERKSSNMHLLTPFWLRTTNKELLMPPVDANKVDAKVLKALYTGSPAARAILDYFASRTYNAVSTKVDSLETRLRRDGHEFPRRDVVSVFKQLADAGCGSFVTGRRGQPSRLEWSVQLTSVAKAAKGEGLAVAKLDPSEVGVTEEEDDVPTGLLRHPFRLRPGLTLNLELPENLTVKEAMRLADFVKTLPFDADEDA
jgi:hypothetical protein